MNDTETTAITHEEMLLDIGKRLYEARTAKGISQEMVAANLKLSLSQVKGLETGDWSLLPDGIYALGFLRQYATMLEVDVIAEINQLKTKLSLKQPVTIADPAIAPTRRWAIFSFLLFIVLAFYFNMQVNNDASSVLMKTTNVIPSPTTSITQPMIKTEEIITSSSTFNNKAINAASIEPSSHQESPVVAVIPATDKYSKIHHVLLSAVGGDVWLTLSSVESESKRTTKLKEILLQDGQKTSIDTAENHLLLTAGNAIALSISIDDVIRYPAGTLGTDGRVLRKFSLDIFPK